jgi:hypothetical protein
MAMVGENVRGRQETMNPWPIRPLIISDLNFQPKNYDFTTLTANELGDTPNLLASIDQTVNEFITSIVDQSNLLLSTEHDLDDLGSILSEIDSDTFDTIATELGAAAAAGDALAGAGDFPLSF